MKKKRMKSGVWKDWVLPPKVKSLILYWKNRSKRKAKKYWFYQPIPADANDLPYFSLNKKRAHWLSLGKEVRPGIVIEGSAMLEIPLEDDRAGWIQFGLGANSDFVIGNVDIFIDQQRVGTLRDIIGQHWHDVRLPLENKRNNLGIKIEVSGKGALFFSYPLIYKKMGVQSSQPKNIICLVLDGVTPEYLQKDTAPFIRHFFQDGVFCNQVYSQSDWTLPAFSSMLTSLYPSKHGVYNPDQFDSAIPDSTPVVTEILRSQGFRTFGYSSHIRFSPAYGHARGFERFIFAPLAYGDYYIREINEAIQHLEAHKRENNFLFLHFFDTHYPYQPLGYLKNILMGSERDFSIYEGAFEEQESRQLLEYLSCDCKTKVREIDLALNALFSYIQQQPWFKDSIVILTADHGISHRPKGKPLFLKDRVNIPLCVKGPTIRQGENNALIEGNVDLMPSILFMAGLSSPKNIDGKIWPFLGKDSRCQVFTESLFRTVYEASIRDGNYSYHLKCPFDQERRKIFFKENTVSVFERLNEEEIEKVPSKDCLESIRSKFKSYLEVKQFN